MHGVTRPIIDIGWLHMQAFPQLSLTDLSTALISPSQLSTLIATLEDGNTRLGIYTTLLSLPIKLILALAAIHLSCLPHVAEQRPFRFVMPAALVGTPNGNTPRGGEEASSAAPASAPVTAEPVTHKTYFRATIRLGAQSGAECRP